MKTPVVIPFQTIDWTGVEKTIHAGETGQATWQTVQFHGLRMRMVQYSAGYRADHWCSKGHIVHCISGSFESELDTGEKFSLRPGASYVVTDNASNHQSISGEGACLLIIDGDFLQTQE